MPHSIRPRGAEAPSRPWTRRLLLIPIATAFLFAGLTAMSFVDLKSRKPEATVPRQPVSAAVLARYEEESRALGQIRESAREKLTVEAVLSIFEGKGPDALPATERLLSDVRSLERRAEGSSVALVPGLLSFLKRVSGDKEKLARVALADALLSQVIFSAEKFPALGAGGRDDLLDALAGAVERQSPSTGALLLLLAEVGTCEDVPRLAAIKGKVQSVQLSHEISKVLEILGTKELESGGQ